MKQPAISIVLPTYNRADSFLKKAVTSVLEQSLTDFELIIIDDGSEDQTQELIQSFSDDRIVFHKNDNNKGEYYSTNLGVSRATTPYLTWIHSDDVMPKDSLRTRLEFLQSNSDLDLVHGAIQKIDSEGKEVELLDTLDWPKQEILKEEKI